MPQASTDEPDAPFASRFPRKKCPGSVRKTRRLLTCMGYFQSLKNPANEKFVKAFKAKYGANRVLGDTLECGYISVYLWKLAAEKAKSFDVRKVVAASSDLPLDAPEGKIKFHKSNHHLWKHARIGTFRTGRSGRHDLRIAAARSESVPEVVTV